MLQKQLQVVLYIYCQNIDCQRKSPHASETGFHFHVVFVSNRKQLSDISIHPSPVSDCTIGVVADVRGDNLTFVA